MELVIEELGRGDKVTHRHKHTSESITLGRCYTSDIIVDDLHVDPEHAKLLMKDGQWTVLDVSAVNGVKVNGKEINKNAYLIKSGDIIKLGKVSFRIVTDKMALKPTLPITFIEDIIDICKKPPVLAFNLFLFASLYALSLYQSSYYEVATSKLLIHLMTNTAWYTLPPIVAALAAFALRQTPNIMGQAGIYFAMFNVITVFTYIFSIITFSFGDAVYLSALFSIVQCGFLLLLVWLSLRVSFDQTAGKRILSSLVIFTLVSGVLMTKEMSGKSNFSSLPKYNNDMIPSALIFKQGQKVEAFINSGEGVFKPHEEKD